LIEKFSANTGLLLVDVQYGVDDLRHWGGEAGERNNPDAEQKMAMLLDAFRTHGRHIFYTTHDSLEERSPLKLRLPGGRIKKEVTPRDGEIVVRKQVNSGFIGTDLELWLRRCGVSRIVTVGFFTNMCVSTTVRMSGNLGFDTYCVSDATSCCNRIGHNGTNYSSDLVHMTTLASLHREFCTVVDSSRVLELL
jgi:nicotinamidase-related amidase